MENAAVRHEAKLEAERRDGVVPAPLPPGGAPNVSEPHSTQAPAAAVAYRLVAAARDAGTRGLIYLASSDNRAAETARALAAFAPDIEVLMLPGWDCLPYDRASPSADIMGRRMAVVRAAGVKAAGPRVLLVSAGNALQLLPPTAAASQVITLQVGDTFDAETFQAQARALGYWLDDRVDEAGEFAVLGEVVDLFPADADWPVRLVLAEGKLSEIRRYDAVTQRTRAQLDSVVIGPASELAGAALEFALDERRGEGLEHKLAGYHGSLQSVLDLLPKARLVWGTQAQARRADTLTQLFEAREARRQFGEALGSGDAGLYLDASAWDAAVKRRKTVELELDGVAPVPVFARQSRTGRAFTAFVSEQLAAGARVIVAGTDAERRRLQRALERALEASAETVDMLDEAAKSGLFLAPFDLDAGFSDAEGKLAVIAAADVFGGRIAGNRRRNRQPLQLEPDLRAGDVVIHEDHGVGILDALERVEVDGRERDTVRLRYYGDASVLAPVEEFGRIWRYGSAPEAVTLDRLNTEGWAKRRATISAEIDAVAQHLVALAKERAEQTAPVLEPPKTEYNRFVARFPFPETPDQTDAITAVLEDLAAGKPMRRLICGDVGFGKTEIALRAAAVAALAGKQVALVAPTTVLARQHSQTFERRFAGTGLKVAHLSRLLSPAEAKDVKAGLADGSIAVVIATHALGGKDVEFKDLGLLIIDEEQKFGAKLKAQLMVLAEGLHVLTMSATPIPRTLQSAMVGIEDVSVLQTPPARRRPIRTLLAPFDEAVMRTALLREKRRGGQSFFVVPRIEDIDAIAERLKRVVPELSTRVAHGELPPDAVDETMVDFADGEGDVLLSTNIIESGLDVPRANTMLVWHPDRFGLAQLHQLRGRVGRGRAQGIAYLFTDPEEPISEATRNRLSTLEAFDRLGSGLAISARDLDLRGAGDIAGEAQAGHVNLIGTGLYSQLLARAVAVAKGDEPPDAFQPVLNLGVAGAIPVDYVPEATVRINLYARLLRMTEASEVADFADELEDRFGELPDEAKALLSEVQLQCTARTFGIERIDAGPLAIALNFRHAADRERFAEVGDKHLAWKDERLILKRQTEESGERLEAVSELLERLASG